MNVLYDFEDGRFVGNFLFEDVVAKIVMVKGEKGDNGESGDYAELTNKPSIGNVTLSGNKTAYDLGLATPYDISSAISTKANQSDLDETTAKTDNIIKSSNTLLAIGSGSIQSMVYLEEGNAGGTNLYFRMFTSLNFMVNGEALSPRSWDQVKANCGGVTVTSPCGMPDCLQIPNNNALVYDIPSRSMKYVDRTSVTDSQIVLFFNSFGRAENLHQTLLEARIIGLQNAIVNVKTFGAWGDGANDDTRYIQSAIEYAKNKGGIVFFPKGRYLLSTALFNASNTGIASALMCYDGQTLIGDNAILKVGSASVTHTIFTYNASNATGYDGCEGVTIEGITFDGNTSLSNDITHINISHAQNVRVKECSFVNGRSWHSIEINSSRNVKVENCVFHDNANTEDIQIDSASGNGNLGSNDGTVCEDIEILGCDFTVNGYPAIGNHTDAAHSNIRIHDNVFSGNGGSRGYISFVASQTKTDIYDNTFKDSTKGTTFENTSNGGSVRDNRFINVTTPFSGGVIEYNNIINDVMKSIFSDKGFTFPKTVSDLNTVMTTQSIGSIVMVQYSNTVTSNRPSNDSGICLSGRNTGSGGYGWQIAFTNNGFYWRKYASNAFQAWTSLT